MTCSSMDWRHECSALRPLPSHKCHHLAPRTLPCLQCILGLQRADLAPSHHWHRAQMALLLGVQAFGLGGLRGSTRTQPHRVCGPGGACVRCCNRAAGCSGGLGQGPCMWGGESICCTAALDGSGEFNLSEQITRLLPVMEATFPTAWSEARIHCQSCHAA